MTQDITDAGKWAEETFGRAELGDPRRTRRLVKVASQLARTTGASFAAACGDDRAASEGAYRLARNHHVDPDAVAEAGLSATAMKCEGVECLLALEDSTTLSYSHAVADELGDLGGKADATARGFWVHSVLVVEADRDVTVGLVHQQRWLRDSETRGKKHDRREREYQDKESFKWQRASEALRARLGPERMKRVVSVCDREADIYAYVAHKQAHHERFVVRAAWDRKVADEGDNREHLFRVVSASPACGQVVIEIPQRGGRQARTASLTLRTAAVRLLRPDSLGPEHPARVGVNVVLAREESPPAGVEPLEWILLTSEPINTAKEVERVLQWYGRRWGIEVFHKAWKSGAGVEELRMQSADNLERIAVVQAFTAVRLMQLREMFEQKRDVPCDQILDGVEWKILWLAVEKTRPPRKCPTGQWAYHALGRMAGWTDTKHTGVVGWDTLWTGWQRLQERVDTYRAMRQLEGEKL